MKRGKKEKEKNRKKEENNSVVKIKERKVEKIER